MSSIEQTDPPASARVNRGGNPAEHEAPPRQGAAAAGSTRSAPKPPERPRRRRVVVIPVVLLLICIAATVAVHQWLIWRQYEDTDDAYIDGHIIPISPQVAARISQVLVNDNEPVKTNQVLVRLDPSDYEAALAQKQAVEASMRNQLQQAQAQLAVDRADVLQAKAAVDVAQANATNAEEDYQRFAHLDPRARSQQQLDNSQAAQRSTSAAVEQSQARLAAAQAQVLSAQAAIDTAQSQVQKAAADVRQAKLQVSYCTIVAPQDGVVTRKNVETGMYVTVGQPLFSIVPTDVWITANFKETQLDMMRPGQPVIISVDAYPDKTFHGHVQSIQMGTGAVFSLLPAENATGNFVKVVQRVPVKIVFDPREMNDPQHPLALGMSVEPEVKVQPWQSLWSLLGLDQAKHPR
jgi:membrane fusion protein, multidrug efflux system